MKIIGYRILDMLTHFDFAFRGEGGLLIFYIILNTQQFSIWFQCLNAELYISIF